MQRPPKQNDLQTKIEARLRTMRTLWVAMFLSVVIYFGITVYLSPRTPQGIQNSALSLLLVASGLLATLVAVLVKQRFLTQSVELQQDVLVQQGYVLAWAITEAAALLGLLDFFLTGNRYYSVLFIVAACGHLYNCPRRQHVLDACGKGPGF